MKRTYVSPSDFQKNCACAFYLTAFAESLFPHQAQVTFWKGRQVSSEPESYEAEYTVDTGKEKYHLAVSCTKQPDGSYIYNEVSRTEIL